MRPTSKLLRSTVAAWIGLLAACSGATSASPSDVVAGPPECPQDPQAADPCHTCLRQGALAGDTRGATCRYLGIPYAKPPIAERRFTAPEPASSWDGVRDATSFGAACVQGFDLSGSSPQSEDCLFVNVWTPRQPSATALPVMVFVYGGGYNGGASNTYEGTALSERGPAVIVSMNYRVGALGFFAHPELDEQRGDEPSGSDGIRDQQLALRWVKNNIGAFHGDPRRVTLFGESAGSSGVGVHIVSPRSRELASRFILESGVTIRGVANGLLPATRAQAYARAQQLSEALCPGALAALECLRGLPAERVMQWGGGGSLAAAAPGMSLGWVPVVEGEGGVLPDSPDALMERGELHRGPVIVGTNRNEYGLFLGLNGARIDGVDALRSRVQMQFGAAQVDAIMALYAPEPSADPRQAYITLMTDVMFRCASRRFARLASAKGSSVYLYSFDQGTAYHADELPYVFGEGNTALNPASTVASVAESVQRYWLNFATTGDPNGYGAPSWPKYRPDSDEHLTLADPPAAGSGLQKAACDFWDQYLASAAGAPTAEAR